MKLSELRVVAEFKPVLSDASMTLEQWFDHCLAAFWTFLGMGRSNEAIHLAIEYAILQCLKDISGSTSYIDDKTGQIVEIFNASNPTDLVMVFDTFEQLIGVILTRMGKEDQVIFENGLHDLMTEQRGIAELRFLSQQGVCV